MGGLFVTGTDTGVGKTFVASGIARHLSDRQLRVGVMKPVETGCARRGADLEAADAVRLMAAARSTLEIPSVCPYRFEEPLAPDVAARRAGRQIDPAIIRNQYESIAASSDVTIVEGAGGLLVPIWERYTMAALAADLGLPLLVVVGSRLGAVNHTLLTLETARSHGLEVAGYVLNHVNQFEDAATDTNAELLARSTDVRCAGVIAFGGAGALTVEDAASAVARAIAVDDLLTTR